MSDAEPPAPALLPDKSFTQNQPNILSTTTDTVHVRIEMDVLPGTTVQVSVEKGSSESEPRINVEAGSSQNKVEVFQSLTAPALKGRSVSPRVKLRLPGWISRIYKTARKALTLETSLFGSALGLYLITRLIGLTKFPIYFFTDEAVQTMLASDLVRDHLVGGDHVFLPTFFQNSYQYNLCVSVYLQLIPYLTVGRQVWATRGICVLVTLLAAICTGLTLKNIFHSPYAWGAVLLLSITPAWFLHSRTAFETGLATTFYAALIYFYLRYRTASPKYIYATVGMAALCFYSYSPAELVVAVTVILLALSDIRYHWQNRRTVLYGLGIGLILLLPLLRFQIIHPDENLTQLQLVGSYWVQPISIIAKFGNYFSEYLKGLNPLYWYLPNRVDLVRHVMKGYGHIMLATLPLALLGIGVAIWQVRSPIYRSLLLVFLAVPSGEALASLGITRTLFMVIPLALFSAIGLTVALQWIEKHLHISTLFLTIPVFVLMAGVNIYMLNDALVNGPLWFNDYGLYGMQYGSQQLFGGIKEYLAQNPQTKLIVSPSWANGTDTIARFFFNDPQPFTLGSIAGYITQYQPIDQNTMFVMIPSEYQDTLKSGKFTDVKIEKTLYCPDGQPCFYYVHLRYVDNIDQIFAQEEAARRILQQATLIVDGGPARVSYSYLDMGPINNIFDNDPGSLIRTFEANPLVVLIDFEQPHPIEGLTLHIGGERINVKIVLQDASGNQLLDTSQTVPNADAPRDISFIFNTTYQVSHLRVEEKNVDDGEPSHVHMWQITFK